MSTLAEKESATEVSAAALARKRRIELRNMQRSSSFSEDSESSSCSDWKRARVDEADVDLVTSKPKPSITGIKRQHRYDPGVSMTREELKAWRKEARRVRNRESAAASRKRNRERITELESEVDVLKTKYSAALKRILDLEAGSSVGDIFTPKILRQDLANLSSPLFGPRPSTPQLDVIKTVSPPASPTASYEMTAPEQHLENVNRKYQHIMEMISRPVVST